MLVGEGEVGCPVEGRDVVRPGADVIAERVARDGLADGRLVVDGESGLRKERVNGLCVLQSEEFTDRIAQSISRGARNVEESWRYQGEQLMLVNGQSVLAVAIGKKFRTKPKRKADHDI